MDLIIGRDWWATLQVVSICGALGLLGAIVFGVL